MLRHDRPYRIHGRLNSSRVQHSEEPVFLVLPLIGEDHA